MSPKRAAQLLTVASCLDPACPWRVSTEDGHLDAAGVDLEARRHTGERALRGGPGHPAVVREGDATHLRRRPTVPPGPGEISVAPLVAGVCGTDLQILRHDGDMALVLAVARGEPTRAGGSPGSPWLLAGESVRMDLRRLAREDVLTAPMGGHTPPALLPRGQRLLEMFRGEVATPYD